ncbi:hypothetical protein DCCM_3970 [Desulfocucumis palustris]|uniref:Uncharacterized protein n=1 Tax=Desulfocucumis palustris TaxID=1898651 RepID=A0A2L2XFB3_9FIRM|nr:hypothetical protein DCCM_3970 [Desulfocucumis palustris]
MFFHFYAPLSRDNAFLFLCLPAQVRALLKMFPKNNANILPITS